MEYFEVKRFPEIMWTIFFFYNLHCSCLLLSILSGEQSTRFLLRHFNKKKKKKKHHLFVNKQ